VAELLANMVGLKADVVFNIDEAALHYQMAPMWSYVSPRRPHHAGARGHSRPRLASRLCCASTPRAQRAQNGHQQHACF